MHVCSPEAHKYPVSTQFVCNIVMHHSLLMFKVCMFRARYTRESPDIKRESTGRQFIRHVRREWEHSVDILLANRGAQSCQDSLMWSGGQQIK